MRLVLCSLFGNDRSSSGRYMFPSRWSCPFAVPLLDIFICETLFLHEFSTSTRCKELLIVNARVYLRKESKHIVLRRMVDSVSSNELLSRACGSLAPRSGLTSKLHRIRAHVSPRSLSKHLEMCRHFDRVAPRENGQRCM